MDLTRFQRILRARWLVLALVAVLSIWLATELTQFRNDRRPTREAHASISFFKQLGEVDDEAVTQRISDAAEAAAEVNLRELNARLHPLAPWEIAEIFEDSQDLQLVFIGRADTDEGAAAIATRIRDAYLAQEPFTEIEEIDAQLVQVALKLSELQNRINSATAPEPPLTAEEVEAQRKQAALEAQIEALRTSYNEIAVTLLDEDLEPDEIAELLADQDRLLTLLLQYELTLEALQPPEEEEPVTEEGLTADLQMQLWESEFTSLVETYETLFQQKTEFENLNRIEPVQLVRSNLEPVAPINNQALALLAGLLVAAVGLVLADRVRRPLWTAQDIEGMVALPEIPPRGWRDPVGKAWYLGTGPSRRKSGIQVLRATIENLPDVATIGLTGVGVFAEDVQELAADLAVAVAISGKQTLLVNADFGHQSHLYEIEPGMVTLASLIETTPDVEREPELARRAITRSLMRRPETVPGLRALPAGVTSTDATDMLSRPSFAAIIDAATDEFDLVIVSGADAADPITHVLSQRLDAMVFVGSAGHTTTTALDVAKREFAGRRAFLVGMTLLRRRPTRLRRRLSGMFRRDHRQGPIDGSVVRDSGAADRDELRRRKDSKSERDDADARSGHPVITSEGRRSGRDRSAAVRVPGAGKPKAQPRSDVEEKASSDDERAAAEGTDGAGDEDRAGKSAAEATVEKS